MPVKRLAKTALAGLLLGLALAAAAGRIIVIEYPNGTRSGNLRYGPWVYTANEPGGIRGRVGNLEILATKAVLEAPKGKSMQAAKGERTATFEGEVVVRRGRIEARGKKLVYQEATGIGKLFGPAVMVQRPAKEGEDPVRVEAEGFLAFDVDDDTSESEGRVRLESGPQEGFAERVYYEEERALAIFKTPGGRVRLVRHREKGGDLVIEAEEARMLAREKKLLAKGNVVLTDGDLVTRGDALYYDDEKGEAIVIGKPAVSEDRKRGRKLSAGTLLHDVQKHRVRLYGKPFSLPEAEFAAKKR